jgi:hypothetical protein
MIITEKILMPTRQSIEIMGREYPSDWRTRRKKVLKRDGYECQNCGVKGGSRGRATLHAHHIVPKSNGGSHKLSNLKTVCHECHKAVHGNVMAPTNRSSSSSSSANHGFLWWLFVAPIGVFVWIMGATLKLTVWLMWVTVSLMIWPLKKIFS